jgi:NAD(P)-dependent dehydrogenase (short-subunit alcohol dehydrogenase family)
MSKTIFITGSTDGIGLEAAKALAAKGHNVLLHGRNAAKLSGVKSNHAVLAKSETFQADLSDLENVKALAAEIKDKYARLDVVINNAGVFKTAAPLTADGLDVRFVVNTLAPYYLTRCLLPLMDETGRVINVSSAAQAPVDSAAMTGQTSLADGAAYAQSKLALTMWSRHMADNTPMGPAIIAVNPGSFLGTKMVKEAYGSAGKDIGIGSEILTRLATSSEYADASGQYFDNDIGKFGPPHADALNPQKNKQIIDVLDEMIRSLSGEKE